MKNGLNKPYPLELSFKNRWLNCLWFSLFVFCFLIFFQPFELHRVIQNKVYVSLGYALVCFFVMAFLNIAVFASFPSYFNEAKWTAIRELFWVLSNIAFIGLGNFLFSVAIGFINFNMLNLLVFEGYTLAIGFFPVMATVFYNQDRLTKRFQDESQEINSSLSTSPHTPTDSGLMIHFASDSGTEVFDCRTVDLLFIKAADNYVEIHYLDLGIPRKKLLRQTLKNIIQSLPFKEFVRCHKSYIVNLNQIESSYGNAQGYKLRIKNTSEVVPVSRSNSQGVKQYLLSCSS